MAMPQAPVRVAAILLGAQESLLPLRHADRVLNRRTIAGLVRKHAHRLPLARALGLSAQGRLAGSPPSNATRRP